jgi:hypothetical protein
MTAIVKAISFAFPATSAEIDILKTIAIFCGVGLAISLCVASYGVDLSTGLF